MSMRLKNNLVHVVAVIGIFISLGMVKQIFRKSKPKPLNRQDDNYYGFK